MSDVRVLKVLPLIELFSQALAACHYTQYKTLFHWKTNTCNTICCLSRRSFRFNPPPVCHFRERHVKISYPLPRYYLLLWHLFKASLSNKPNIPGELLMRMVHLIKNEQVTTPRSLPFCCLITVQAACQISLHWSGFEVLNREFDRITAATCDLADNALSAFTYNCPGPGQGFKVDSAHNFF